MLKKVFLMILVTVLTLSSVSTPIIAVTPPTYDFIGLGYDSQGHLHFIYDGMIPVEKNSKWGFCDINGKLVIPCKYDYVKGFYANRAPVKLGNKWGVIDTSGKLVVPFQYDDITSFEYGGHAAVLLNNKWGAINATGKIIIKMQYSSVLSMPDGSFTVKGNTNYLQFDKDGNEISLDDKYPGYDGYYVLSPQYSAVIRGHLWGIIDNTGRELIPPKYPVDYSYPPGLVNDIGLFSFVGDSVSGGIVDKNDNIVLPFEFEIHSRPPGFMDFNLYFSDGLSLVQSKKDGKTSYIDKNGKIVFTLENRQPVTFGEILQFQSFNFSEGRFRIVYDYKDNGFSFTGGRWGFIDKTGKIVAPPQYDTAFNYQNGYAAVKKNGKLGFINREGKVVIPLVYDNVAAFRNGMVVVCNKGKYGVVDSLNKIILPLSYDAPPSYNSADGLFIVKKDGKFGFVDKSNKLIIPIKYQSVSHFSNGLARVESGYQYGYINKSNKAIIPIKYYSLSDIYVNRVYATEKSGVLYILDTSGKVILKASHGIYIITRP